MSKLANKIKSLFKKDLLIGPITNFSGNIKTVAICYLTEPFFGKFYREIPPRNNIINIAGVFLDLGYQIYVLDYKNGYKKVNDDQKFDVIFGFGASFFELTKNNIHSNTKKIFYYTELSEKYNSELERRRKAELEAKGYVVRKKSLRSRIYYEDAHAAAADAILLTGAEYQLQHFKHFEIPKHAIQPSSILNSSNTNVTLSSNRKNNFIWFGSNGGVLKGLDILIESFSRLPDNKLFLLGLSKSDRKTFLQNRCENIFDLGFHNVRSQRVKDIAEECKYVISTSFSEGSTTGVLTGMGYGCVPVISTFAGTNINSDTQAILIDEMTVDSVVSLVSQLNRENIVYDHSAISAFALENYSAKSFKLRFMDKIQEIINA